MEEVSDIGHTAFSCLSKFPSQLSFSWWYISFHELRTTDLEVWGLSTVSCFVIASLGEKKTEIGDHLESFLLSGFFSYRMQTVWEATGYISNIYFKISQLNRRWRCEGALRSWYWLQFSSHSSEFLSTKSTFGGICKNTETTLSF